MSSQSCVQSKNGDDDVPLIQSVNVARDSTTSSGSISITSTSSSSSDGGRKTPKKVSKKEFTKIALIGRGNVGRVYLVEQNNTLYSMKVIVKKNIEDRVKEQRIEGEITILKQLDHPFIVKLYHSFETPFYHMYVMTYCPGGDFWRLLHRQPGKCFVEKTAQFYLAEIVCALEYLHMQDVVYRDLKPENILLTETGHIMLSDFDLSKHSSEEERARIKTNIFGNDEIIVEPSQFHSNSFVGTNEYLAPEIIAKDGHSASVDWWTLGVLMYEFLYGCNPFVAPTIKETYDNIQSGTYSFPKKHFNKVSRAAKDLIKELLDVDSEDRLGSREGAVEIKQHEFFKDIKFALIRNTTPPIVPGLSGQKDIRMFPKYEAYEDDVPDDWGRAMEAKLRKEARRARNKKTSSEDK